MSVLTQAALDHFRRRWVRTVIDTYAFGMYTIMVMMTLYYLCRGGNAWIKRRATLSYTLLMMVITMAWFYSQTRIDEAETIETLAGPGVSSEIAVGNPCTPTDFISNTASMLQFWGNDVLMLSRAYTIFDGNLVLLAIPGAMFVAFMGLGILLVVSCSPHVYIANVNAVVMAHYSISALFNVLITGMIVTKLLLHRRRMRRHLVCESGGVVGDVYISAIGVLAESAGLYSGSLIIYVVLYARQSPEVIWFSAVIMSASFLSQAWIILRIAMGSTYIRSGASALSSSASTTTPPMELRFVRGTSTYPGSEHITTSVSTFVKTDDTDASIPMRTFKV